MTENELKAASEFQARLYESYASTHAGVSDAAVSALTYRRDIRPFVGRPGGRVLDVGCGQGGLVRLMLNDGYDAFGVDISPEQVKLAHSVGLTTVKLGDYMDLLNGASTGLDAVVATDLLEHLTKSRVLELFDAAHGALKSGGRFIGRTPNGASPFGGAIQYGDFTHESVFTSRSLGQVAHAAGFDSVIVRPCPPVIHGLPSRARALVWRGISGVLKAAVAVETGQWRHLVVTQNMTFVAQRNESHRR